MTLHANYFTALYGRFVHTTWILIILACRNLFVMGSYDDLLTILWYDLNGSSSNPAVNNRAYQRFCDAEANGVETHFITTQ